MNIHKSLDGNKDKSINPFELHSNLKSEKRLNNIKKLADEMVQMVIERKKFEAEEKLNDDTIFYDVDVQTYKHKSQIFINRNHNQLLRNFSLTKSNEDNNLKSINSIIRRKNKQITAQNIISYSKNKISFHLGLKNKNDLNNNDNVNENINEEEKKSEENKGKSKSGFDSGEDIFSKKSDEDKNMLNNQEFDNSLDYEEHEKYDDDDNMEKYEILYINPSQLTQKEKEELSTKNDEDKINENKKYLDKKVDIGKYLFEKGKKMINFRNKKINKVNEIRESKTKSFFDIKNFVKKNAKTTYTKNDFSENEKEETYIPLHYKAGELHRIHLTKIALNQKNKFIKKELEEQKEMNKNVNKQKVNKNFWNNFLDRENQWKQNNINIRKESLKKKEKKEKDNIYDRPKINKDSIIILKHKNKSNKLNTNTNINKIYINPISSNKYKNIYTKLYKDKEIYDNKLKQRIYNSLPTFSPKIIENKRHKTINNNTLFTTKNNNINKINKTQNKMILKYHKKANKKEIYLNDVNINQKKFVTSISTKQFNQSKISNKKDINRNKKPKKTFVFELNINNSNFGDYNKDKSNIKKNNISSYIKKLGKNAEKNFERNKKIIYRRHLSETNLIQKNQDENNNYKLHINNENSNLIENENLAKKNKFKKRKKLEINSCTKLLYNINTAEHTSNNVKQFVVLTTKKYIDFFK